jgi:hypothetical protein
MLQPGDIGIDLSGTIFSRIQNWLRKKIGEADYRASHTFYVKQGTRISEAYWNGVKPNDISKYLDGDHKIWIFRNSGINSGILSVMQAYVQGAEDSGGLYSYIGILQHGKKLLGMRASDERGVFCSEYTSNIINQGQLGYMTRAAHRITPSYKLSGLRGSGPRHGWFLSLYHDKGTYYKA